ncbi:MAG: tetratricopeptide repeat protein [Planctomycetes bacterium]|nr:tetratricopeptide repeat protein [Planctomycetota bacterium]
MFKKGLRFVLFAMACVVLAGCFEPKTPTVDGRKVLTGAQYEELMAKMKTSGVKEEVAEAAAQANGGDSAFANGARFYQNRDFANAAVEFEKVVSSDAGNSKAWYMLGACYEHTGNVEKAQSAFKQSYDIMVAQGYIADINKIR